MYNLIRLIGLLVELKLNHKQLMKFTNKNELNVNNKNVIKNVIDNNVENKIVVANNNIQNHVVVVVVVVLNNNQIEQMMIEVIDLLLLIQYDNYKQMINEIQDQS